MIFVLSPREIKVGSVKVELISRTSNIFFKCGDTRGLTYRIINFHDFETNQLHGSPPVHLFIEKQKSINF